MVVVAFSFARSRFAWLGLLFCSLISGGVSVFNVKFQCNAVKMSRLYVCLSVCLSIYLSTYLSIYLSTYLSIYLSMHVGMYVCMYVGM